MNPKKPSYKIDVRQIKSAGDFPCPKCGVAISPSDLTETTYQIVESLVRNDALEKLTLICNKCSSKIELIGFVYVPPPRSKLIKKYEKLRPLYEQLVSEVKFILTKNLKKSDIIVHSVDARVKNFNSFYEKVIRKEIEKAPFEEITDIVAVRVICLYLKDLQRIGDIIAKQFLVLETDISRTRSEEPFGYMSDHYIISLPEGCAGARYDEIKNLKCEIQVRTILMHAWASVSHHLDYKKKIDIPSSLRRDFNALSGLFYVADTHFETFRENIEQAKRKLEKSVKKDEFDLNQEINLDSLHAYLQWRLPERKTGKVDSTLLNSIIKKGYTQFLEIDDFLRIVTKNIVTRIEKLEGMKGKHLKMSQADILKIVLNPISLKKYL